MRVGQGAGFEGREGHAVEQGIVLGRGLHGHSKLLGYRERSRRPMEGATVALSIDIPFTHALALWAGGENHS